MNKFSNYIATIVLLLFVFWNLTAQNKIQTGADKDSHGCIGSAGYQWSTLAQKCIRVFELPLQLLNSGQTQIAGVVFSKDEKKAEVFTSSANYILEKKSKTSYILNTSSSKKFLTKKNEKWEFGDSQTNKIEYKEE